MMRFSFMFDFELDLNFFGPLYRIDRSCETLFFWNLYCPLKRLSFWFMSSFR
jgi:hypothetical protein